MTYDAGGNYRVSGSPVSGPDYHDLGSCTVTPQERIRNLMIWVNVEIAAGVLDSGGGSNLLTKLEAALRNVDAGNTQPAINEMNAFVNAVDAMGNTGRLSAPVARLLREAAVAALAQLSQG